VPRILSGKQESTKGRRAAQRRAPRVEMQLVRSEV